MFRRVVIIACVTVSLVLPFRIALPADSPTRLLSRPNERINDDGGYLFDIPRGVNERAASQELARSMPTLKRDHTLTILSPDPALAARIARESFSACQPHSLVGLKVYCLVSPQYERYLRPSALRAGVTLTCSTQTQLLHPPRILKPAGRRMFYKGQTDARRDIARSRLVLRGSFPSRVFQKLLLERYHIEAPIIHPYETTLEDWGYDVGYNSISVPAIERRYGRYVLEKVLIDSRKKALPNKGPAQTMLRTPNAFGVAGLVSHWESLAVSNG